MADGCVEQYVDKQKLLRRLKEAGILLAAVSKNAPENLRWDEMVLKPEDFVSLKIGWGLKAQSVLEVADELNLGMDSFILIDDNPAEIDLVVQACPGVVGLDSSDEKTWAMLEMLFLFPNTQETEESRARTQMYREQIARQKSVEGDLDYPEMMRSLDLRVAFGTAKPKDLGRLSELINRTNQFNTTTIRYSKTDLSNFITNQSSALYVAELADKFGKLGLVAAAIVSLNGKENCTIELFVMSCRAMGYGLENLVLGKIIEAEKSDHTKFIGRFVPSDRNAPASAFFRNNGFEQTTETDWHLSSTDRIPRAPEWFTVTDR